MSENKSPTCEGGCGPYRLERYWFGDMLVCERCEQVKALDVVAVKSEQPPVQQYPEATP